MCMYMSFLRQDFAQSARARGKALPGAELEAMASSPPISYPAGDNNSNRIITNNNTNNMYVYIYIYIYIIIIIIIIIIIMIMMI